MPIVVNYGDAGILGLAASQAGQAAGFAGFQQGQLAFDRQRELESVQQDQARQAQVLQHRLDVSRAVIDAELRRELLRDEALANAGLLGDPYQRSVQQGQRREAVNLAREGIAVDREQIASRERLGRAGIEAESARDRDRALVELISDREATERARMAFDADQTANTNRLLEILAEAEDRRQERLIDVEQLGIDRQRASTEAARVTAAATVDLNRLNLDIAEFNAEERLKADWQAANYGQINAAVAGGRLDGEMAQQLALTAPAVSPDRFSTVLERLMREEPGSDRQARVFRREVAHVEREVRMKQLEKAIGEAAAKMAEITGKHGQEAQGRGDYQRHESTLANQRHELQIYMDMERLAAREGDPPRMSEMRDAEQRFDQLVDLALLSFASRNKGRQPTGDELKREMVQLTIELGWEPEE